MNTCGSWKAQADKGPPLTPWETLKLDGLSGLTPGGARVLGTYTLLSSGPGRAPRKVVLQLRVISGECWEQAVNCHHFQHLGESVLWPWRTCARGISVHCRWEGMCYFTYGDEGRFLWYSHSWGGAWRKLRIEPCRCLGKQHARQRDQNCQGSEDGMSLMWSGNPKPLWLKRTGQWREYSARKWSRLEHQARSHRASQTMVRVAVRVTWLGSHQLFGNTPGTWSVLSEIAAIIIIISLCD